MFGFRVILWAALLGAGGASAGRVCDLVFSTCPERFASGGIAVPVDIVALSPRIPACAAIALLPAEPVAAPSIVFAIDNSRSMGANDPEEARFAAVATLLDDIYALAPSAEVGLVLFSRRLQFDRRDNPLFAPAFPGDTAQHDAYVPLISLDAVFPDGRTGLDTLKALLRHDAVGDLAHATRHPASRENDELGRLNLRDGTDITLGLEAARAALAAAKAAPGDRYLVLLTDGEPASVDAERVARRWEFAGAAGVPTSFVVAFDTASPPALHDSLAVFAARARAYGNARSAAWAVAAPGAGLRGQLRSRLFAAAEVSARPERAVLAVGDSVQASTGIEDGSLLFPGAVPLREASTPVRLAVTYSYPTSADPFGGPTGRKELGAAYTLSITRNPSVTELPSGLSAFCREQPSLAVLEGGREADAVGPGPGRLEARLAMPAGSSCSPCRVELTTAAGSGRAATPARSDTETVALVGAEEALSAAIEREAAGRGMPGDGKVQLRPGDSLVVTWRNPQNPLDRVRRAYPVLGVGTVLGVTGTSNSVSLTQGLGYGPSTWRLVGAPSLKVAARVGTPEETVPGPLSEIDSLRYVGLDVVASRPFRVDVRVFDNLGQYVNKIAFSVPAGEFPKLPLTSDGRNRRLLVLWDNRSEDGRPVGTGTYVLKATVTLDPLPGLPEEDAVRTEYRRIGVLRSL